METRCFPPTSKTQPTSFLDQSAWRSSTRRMGVPGTILAVMIFSNLREGRSVVELSVNRHRKRHFVFVCNGYWPLRHGPTRKIFQLHVLLLRKWTRIWKILQPVWKNGWSSGTFTWSTKPKIWLRGDTQNYLHIRGNKWWARCVNEKTFEPLSNKPIRPRSERKESEHCTPWARCSRMLESTCPLSSLVREFKTSTGSVNRIQK